MATKNAANANESGITVYDAAGTFTGRTLTQPAAGITITNADGTAGNPTFALADDLAALEGLSGTGVIARTAADTYSLRTITEGTGIDITDGDGVSGNPTITVDITEIGSVSTSFATDSGTATPASNILTVSGGEGIDTSGSGSTVTIAGEDASDTNKGIASFVAADFDVAAGAVSLEDTVVKSVAGDSGTATPSSHSFTIAGSGGVSTSGSGSTITITSAGIFQWVEETTTSRSLNVNEGVIANNAALVTCTLPDTAALGDIVRIQGKGAGLFKIGQNAGETIHFGDTDTTTGVGGSITATNQYDSIELVCITANTDWAVLSSVGNFTMV